MLLWHGCGATASITFPCENVNDDTGLLVLSERGRQRGSASGGAGAVDIFFSS